MIDIHMGREGNALVDQARGKGVLINVASGTVIRLVPLCMSGRRAGKPKHFKILAI
jgi:hypothetical protein